MISETFQITGVFFAGETSLFNVIERHLRCKKDIGVFFVVFFSVRWTILDEFIGKLI